MAPVIEKSLSKLSRGSLVNLCSKWAESDNSVPYLSSNRNLLESEEEDYLHEPADNATALRTLYKDIGDQENEKDTISKKDIIDRIVDGDWRRGLSLQQLADIDLANLEQHDTTLRWSALKLVQFKQQEEPESESSHPAKRRKISSSITRQVHYPTISPANFVANLKSHISPLVKAHYTLHKLSAPSNLVILRLYIVPNTPFAPVSSNIPRNIRQATDAGRIMYIALPNSCPYIYVSLSGGTGAVSSSKSKPDDASSKTKINIAATKRIILEAIPKALSRPQERWSLENTKLTCRSLKAIGLLRGNSRPGTAGGCYSKFSEEYEWKPNGQTTGTGNNKNNTNRQSTREEAESTPLTVSQPTLQAEPAAATEHSDQIKTRFGAMSNPTHAKLDRFHVTLSNILSTPTTSKSKPPPSPGSKPSSASSNPKAKTKRKRRSLEDIEAGRDPEPETQPGTEKEVASAIAPAQVSLTFSGVDVFRGLKELASLEGGRFVDLDRLPAWMTGEKGVSGIVV